MGYLSIYIHIISILVCTLYKYIHRNKGKVSKYFPSNIQFDIYNKELF